MHVLRLTKEGVYMYVQHLVTVIAREDTVYVNRNYLSERDGSSTHETYANFENVFDHQSIRVRAQQASEIVKWTAWVDVIARM